MSTLFDELSGQTNQDQQNSQQNNTNYGILGQLNEFAKNFKGNPQEQVQQLIKTGKISQQEYNNAVSQANMLYNMINGKK